MRRLMVQAHYPQNPRMSLCNWYQMISSFLYTTHKMPSLELKLWRLKDELRRPRSQVQGKQPFSTLGLLGVVLLTLRSDYSQKISNLGRTDELAQLKDFRILCPKNHSHGAR